MKARSEPINEIETLLPLQITSISAQKKRPDRFSLFHDDQFLIGVSTQTLVDYPIQKGTLLTPSLYHQLRQTEDYQKIKDAFYRYLSGRDHTSFELKLKVMKKGFTPSLIESVLEEFDRKGLLDDENFAEKFAADKFKFNRWGPVKIKQALVKKGVPKRITEKAVQNLPDNLAQVQICVDLLRKRKQHFLREHDPLKRKQKMYRFLAGKGYYGTNIQKAVDQISPKFDA